MNHIPLFSSPKLYIITCMMSAGVNIFFVIKQCIIGKGDHELQDVKG